MNIIIYSILGELYKAPKYHKTPGIGGCCLSQNAHRYHQRCICDNHPLSECMDFCNEDSNCKGYVKVRGKEDCQIATISSCPSGCTTHDVGNVGKLKLDFIGGVSCGPAYDGCIIKDQGNSSFLIFIVKFFKFD